MGSIELLTLQIQISFFVSFSQFLQKKAEPFKLWLAEVGKDRINETLDPELIAERLIFYL